VAPAFNLIVSRNVPSGSLPSDFVLPRKDKDLIMLAYIRSRLAFAALASAVAGCGSGVAAGAASDVGNPNDASSGNGFADSGSQIDGGSATDSSLLSNADSASSNPESGSSDGDGSSLSDGVTDDNIETGADSSGAADSGANESGTEAGSGEGALANGAMAFPRRTVRAYVRTRRFESRSRHRLPLAHRE
jgi:hypothetical protein